MSTLLDMTATLTLPALPGKPPCPHCGARPNNMYLHLLDTGDATECPPDACPVLFEKRNRNPMGPGSGNRLDEEGI